MSVLEMSNEFVSGFGTRSLGEATLFCDILNTIDQVPERLRPQVVKDIRSYLKEVYPDARGCIRIKSAHTSFSETEKFREKPSVDNWLFVLKYNLYDSANDIKNLQEHYCGDISEKYADINKILRGFGDRINQLQGDLTEEDKIKINVEMSEGWQEEWLEKWGWDLKPSEIRPRMYAEKTPQYPKDLESLDMDDLNALYKSNQKIKTLTRYGYRTEKAKEDSTILSWSNGAQRWNVISSRIPKGKVEKLDANQILLPYSPIRLENIINYLIELPLYAGSYEAKERKQVSKRESLEIWLRGQEENPRIDRELFKALEKQYESYLIED